MDEKGGAPKPPEAAAYHQISRFILRKIQEQGMLVLYRTPWVQRRRDLEKPNEQLEGSRILS
jgi:hypothetical protein